MNNVIDFQLHKEVSNWLSMRERILELLKGTGLPSAQADVDIMLLLYVNGTIEHPEAKNIINMHIDDTTKTWLLKKKQVQYVLDILLEEYPHKEN